VRRVGIIDSNVFGQNKPILPAAAIGVCVDGFFPGELGRAMESNKEPFVFYKYCLMVKGTDLFSQNKSVPFFA